MVIRRRRVYFDYTYSRRMRMERWLSFSIYLAAGIFFLSLLGRLPSLMSLIATWLLPDRLPSRLGFSGAEPSLLATLCEILVFASGVYLALALFISSSTRQGQH